MQDSDDLHRAFGNRPIENDVFPRSVSEQSSHDLCVLLAERMGTVSDLPASIDKQRIILVGLGFRPCFDRVIPNVGEVFDGLVRERQISHFYAVLSMS